MRMCSADSYCTSGTYSLEVLHAISVPGGLVGCMQPCVCSFEAQEKQQMLM